MKEYNKDTAAVYDDTIPGTFWESLGLYVYGYMEQDKFVYIGKGNKNRALSHVKTKNYDTDNLYIIARNLEDFRYDKEDLQSYILESFLIATNDPRDNTVAGHYKECFVMAKFSELFEEFKKDQHDNFETMPDWFTENYNVFAGNINVMTVKSTHHHFEFRTRKQLQAYLEINTEEQASVKVAIWSAKDIKGRMEKLVRLCESLDIDKSKIVKTGNREFYSIDPEGMTLDLAIKFIGDFYG